MSESSKGRFFVCLSVSAEDSVDDERLRKALDEIASSDLHLIIKSRELKVSHRIEADSESQLNSVCDHLRDQYHLAINVSAPEPVLLETIRESVEAEGKFIRQIGGMGNYGHCKLRVEPLKSCGEYLFASMLGDDLMPREYLSSIERGVQRAMKRGFDSGRDLVDLKVAVVDGSCHAEDSNPMAFEMAGMIALEHAFRNAVPLVLEPTMAIEIEVPHELSAATLNEIYRHRGRIETNETADGWSSIRAVVPLAELLASKSAIAMSPREFVGYEAVPDSGYSDENGTGVTANKPHRPRPNRRSEMARPDAEDE